MISDGPGARCCINSLSNRLQSSLGFRFFRMRKLLIAEATVMTVEDSKRKLFFQKKIHFPLLKLIVDINYAETSRDRVFGSHKAGTLLILFEF